MFTTQKYVIEVKILQNNTININDRFKMFLVDYCLMETLNMCVRIIYLHFKFPSAFSSQYLSLLIHTSE